MPRILRSFEYLEPETVEEAVHVLSKYGANAKVLAGGVDIVDRMRRREIKPEYLVSIQRILRLDYIDSHAKGGIKIGALTTLRSLELSPMLQKEYMFLWEAVQRIGSIQVKNMGTVVGNLCVGTPASDVALPLLALGAELKIASLTLERNIPIESFFIGVNQTILQRGEIVTELLLPPLPVGTGCAFMRIVRTASDIAKVNVAVMVMISNDICEDARIALGSVAPTPIRARKAEEILKGKKPEQKLITEAAEAAAEEVKPITDIRSTAQYRKEMSKVLVREATEKAIERSRR